MKVFYFIYGIIGSVLYVMIFIARARTEARMSPKGETFFKILPIKFNLNEQQSENVVLFSRRHDRLVTIFYCLCLAFVVVMILSDLVASI